MKRCITTLIIFGIFIMNSTVYAQEDHKYKINGYYGIKSYAQFQKLRENNDLSIFDSMTFAWSKMSYDDELDEIYIDMKDKKSGFYLPEGYEEPLYYFKNMNITTQLNIYADKDYDEIFDQKEKIINQIISALEDKKFDGVVIDFELLPIDHKEIFIDFLKGLKVELDKNEKTLVVATSPLDSYDFKEIGQVSDSIILMLHDYDSKVLEKVDHEFVVVNPLTPIESINKDIVKIKQQMDGDLSKFLFQINFAIGQWQVKDGVLINKKAYTPAYESLKKRIEIENKKLNMFSFYDENFKNPYLYYLDHGTYNTIWYEDSRSIKAKIDILKENGFEGLSIWRLGNIPDGEQFYLNVWEEIKSELKVSR
ncbi:hypothetical protein IZY60_10320 [Lutibacter sp. B2]|nr:hypothetical protein [Lutibacter sp. B2]